MQKRLRNFFRHLGIRDGFKANCKIALSKKSLIFEKKVYKDLSPNQMLLMNSISHIIGKHMTNRRVRIATLEPLKLRGKLRCQTFHTYLV